MLRKPDRSETVSTAGQQRDDHVHTGDPVGEVGPTRSREGGAACYETWTWTTGTTRAHLCRHSPVAVEIIQLLLDAAADAAAILSVQPLPHHAQADLTLMLVKCKVLHS